MTHTATLSLQQIKQLRQQIRRKRRTLSRYQLRKAAMQIVPQVLKIPEVQHANCIGIYLDAFGEIPTQPLIQVLFALGKALYLPVISSMNQQLRWQKISFHQYQNQRFSRHNLGMQQAVQGRAINIAMLDVVLMPLVIFDAQGHRVGMGGGFYDRTLATHPFIPKRIGLAHDFQFSTQSLAKQPWDQDLNLVCTPNKIWHF